MFFPKKKDLPLYDAVLEKQYDVVQKLSHDKCLFAQQNAFGFTALEMAKFLFLPECVKILEPDYHKTFNVIHEGDEQSSEYSIELLEKVFGIRYLSHLRFTNSNVFEEIIHQCPWLLRTPIGHENRALAEKYRDQLNVGYVIPSTIKWMNKETGYGLATNVNISAGTYVGEYTGLVRRLYRSRPDHNPYCFQYPTRLWSLQYYIVDALWQGNETRFINHSLEPNLDPICLLDRHLLHTSFIANQDIPAGRELTFNYGPDFWRH